MKRFQQTFAVTGKFCFPLDMLRYDQCWPCSQDDVARISESIRGKGAELTITLCRWTETRSGTRNRLGLMPKNYEVERSIDCEEDSIGTFDLIEDAVQACEDVLLEMPARSVKKVSFRIWEIEGNYSRVVDFLRGEEILARVFKR